MTERVDHGVCTHIHTQGSLQDKNVRVDLLLSDLQFGAQSSSIIID